MRPFPTWTSRLDRLPPNGPPCARVAPRSIRPVPLRRGSGDDLGRTMGDLPQRLRGHGVQVALGAGGRATGVAEPRRALPRSIFAHTLRTTRVRPVGAAGRVVPGGARWRSRTWDMRGS